MILYEIALNVTIIIIIIKSLYFKMTDAYQKTSKERQNNEHLMSQTLKKYKISFLVIHDEYCSLETKILLFSSKESMFFII